jgi:hypothetical protein
MYPIYSNVRARSPGPPTSNPAEAEAKREMRAPQRREESRERPLLLLRPEAGGHQGGQGGHRERRRGREEEEERGGEDGERWENRMAMAMPAAEVSSERVHQLPLRSTSIRLRRRRDQAKQEFLQNRRSGEFGYHSTDLDWGGGGGEKEVFREPLHKPLASSSPRQLLESRSDIADNRRRGGNRRQLGSSSAAAGPVEYTHFGLIDTPPPPPSASAVMEMLGGEQPASLPVTGGEHRNLSLRKGLLWMQRDRLFSRWKERFVILTQDTLYTFKKAVSSIAEMGQFLIKVSAVKKTELSF